MTAARPLTPRVPGGTAAMLTLYAIPVSLYCAKLRILLRHKGLAWQEVPPPGGYGSDAYKAVVPSGNLPALDDGGLLLGDSEAIAEYLNERFPAPPMLPGDTAARAKLRELSRFHDTRLEPELRKLFACIEPVKRIDAVCAAQSQAISARLAQLARLLTARPADAEGVLTLADCGFPVTFAWIDCLTPLLRLDIAWPEALAAYRRALDEHGAVREEIAVYRPTLQSWLQGKTAA